MTLTLIESGHGIAEHRFEVSVDGETVPRERPNAHAAEGPSSQHRLAGVAARAAG
jgi:hypothetical protein